MQRWKTIGLRYLRGFPGSQYAMPGLYPGMDDSTPHGPGDSTMNATPVDNFPAVDFQEANTFFNPPSTYQMQAPMRNASHAPPSFQFDMVQNPSMERQRPIYDAGPSSAELAARYPMGSNLQFAASPSMPPSSRRSSFRDDQGRPTITADPRVRHSTSMSMPNVPGRRDSETQNSRQADIARIRRAQKVQARSHRSGSLTKCWVNDGKVIQLNILMKDGTLIPCRVRCHRKEYSSLVDVDFILKHGFDFRPVPEAMKKRRQSDTPWGKQVPVNYCELEIAVDIGSERITHPLAPQLLPLPEKGIDMILGRSGLREVGLITFSAGKFTVNNDAIPRYA